MDLPNRYRELLRTGDYRYDPAQAAAVERLADLSARLVHAGDDGGLLARLRGALGTSRRREPVTGLYMWGGVGRGKTWLMDMFFDALPFEDKLRSHFHRFMALVHAQLRSLAHEADPLKIVAERLANRTRVVCFDEFFVSDITDAMLLGTLLEELFGRGVCLVATSNTPPEELYRDGLQRSRFLPAIAAIKQHTEVLNLDNGIDYRLRVLEQAEIYHSPVDEASRANMTRYFDSLAVDTSIDGEPIVVANRPIDTVRQADGIVWFEFAAICGGPRSQVDYIEIACEHHTVLVSGVPRFDELSEDRARRFIALVDEFYDRNVKLIVSAAVAPDRLYAGKRLGFEFERTTSRLIEMQSNEYLARPHLP